MVDEPHCDPSDYYPSRRRKTDRRDKYDGVYDDCQPRVLDRRRGELQERQWDGRNRHRLNDAMWHAAKEGGLDKDI